MARLLLWSNMFQLKNNKPLLEVISNSNSVNFQITESQLPPGSILFVKQGEIASPKTDSWVRLLILK